ncbi:hypothetical protein GXN75_06405 [Kroppenstedtia eburnea]|nr:hypothetical protein GXN75_06405 [Kroppenstedtia eburnea]
MKKDGHPLKEIRHYIEEKYGDKGTPTPTPAVD